ncbi:MAG: hypothetical protein MJA27_21135 [Pseudanabaenales cyanobacterium]|nr:hypothetical protein [Pseudanabaenales cyanobacterium]
MSDPVLSKLLAVDSDLEAQAAKLLAQLAAIQAQRSSLQSVLEIFEPDKTTAVVKEGGEATAQMINAPVDSPTQKPAKPSSKRGTKATKAKPAQPRKPKLVNQPGHGTLNLLTAGGKLQWLSPRQF